MDDGTRRRWASSRRGSRSAARACHPPLICQSVCPLNARASRGHRQVKRGRVATALAVRSTATLRRLALLLSVAAKLVSQRLETKAIPCGTASSRLLLHIPSPIHAGWLLLSDAQKFHETSSRQPHENGVRAWTTHMPMDATPSGSGSALRTRVLALLDCTCRDHSVRAVRRFQSDVAGCKEVWNPQSQKFESDVWLQQATACGQRASYLIGGGAERASRTRACAAVDMIVQARRSTRHRALH